MLGSLPPAALPTIDERGSLTKRGASAMGWLVCTAGIL